MSTQFHNFKASKYWQKQDSLREQNAYDAGADDALRYIHGSPVPPPDYDAVTSLTTEVERFMRTNQFTPMQVTNFYVQARVVLTMLEIANRQLKDKERAVDLYKRLYETEELEHRKALAEMDEKRHKINALLREARDNAIASTAETDISDDRKAYRRDLAKRLDDAAKA